MITHDFVDQLEQLIANCYEARNEKLLERVNNCLGSHIKSIQQARMTGRQDAALVLRKSGDSHLRVLRERADYWEEKLFREKVPEHIECLSQEMQLLWIRHFRAEYKKSESVGMSNMAADEAVAIAQREGNE